MKDVFLLAMKGSPLLPYTRHGRHFVFIYSVSCLVIEDVSDDLLSRYDLPPPLSHVFLPHFVRISFLKCSPSHNSLPYICLRLLCLIVFSFRV
jgi:hypothetical protein